MGAYTLKRSFGREVARRDVLSGDGIYFPSRGTVGSTYAFRKLHVWYDHSYILHKQ